MSTPDKKDIISFDDAEALMNLEDIVLSDIPDDPFGAPDGLYEGLLTAYLKKAKKKATGEEFVAAILEFKPSVCIEQVNPDETPFNAKKAKLEIMAEYSAEGLSRIKRQLAAIAQAIGLPEGTKIPEVLKACQGLDVKFRVVNKAAPTAENPGRKFCNITELVIS